MTHGCFNLLDNNAQQNKTTNLSNDLLRFHKIVSLVKLSALTSHKPRSSTQNIVEKSNNCHLLALAEKCLLAVKNKILITT